MVHLRSRHHRYRLRGLQDLRVLIGQLQLELWEHQARRLLGESESSASIPLELVSDLRRNTRTRPETRSSTGASWTNIGRDRDRPVGVPEPPPPPTRMSGSQWLNQGYQEPQSSSSSYRSHVNITSSLTTVPILARTMLNMFLGTLYHALDGFKNIMVIG